MAKGTVGSWTLAWCWSAGCRTSGSAQLLQYVQNQVGSVVLQRQPGVLHGAGELGEDRQAVQGLLGPEGLGLGLGPNKVDLVRPHVSCLLVWVHLQVAEVLVEQVQPLQWIGPKVQNPPLKQEVLFILVTARGTHIYRTLPSRTGLDQNFTQLYELDLRGLH